MTIFCKKKNYNIPKQRIVYLKRGAEAADWRRREWQLLSRGRKLEGSQAVWTDGCAQRARRQAAAGRFDGENRDSLSRGREEEREGWNGDNGGEKGKSGDAMSPFRPVDA